LETRTTPHWIVSVARSAGLPGADTLDIPGNTAVGAAWDAAARRLGVDAARLTACVASHYRLPLADLSGAEARTFRLFPAGLARSLGVLPLRCTDRAISVATADPVSLAAEHEIAEVTGRVVHFEIASPAALVEAIVRAYPGAAEVSVEPPSPRESRERPARILVVDDDADSRTVMRTVLEEAGFEVQEVPDGPEALDALEREGTFDLVTLDLKMEKMSGLELLRHMRGRLSTAGVPVVVATGSEDPNAEMQLFDAGADDFVVKPVDPPRLVLRIRAVLRRRSAAMQGL
jgi:CheY-like chemotaxis protein